ncbi:MAG: TFIIB-type zinc ribbon-containing protein [Myxococcales bacterium]
MATKTAAKSAGAKRKAAPKAKAPKSDEKVHELESQLQESRDALEERGRQLADAGRMLEDARRELQAMRETQAGPAAGKIRCPRCSGSMTEYDHSVVRADRCDDCQGIFFDNGELEQVLEKALKDHDGQAPGGWFSSLFGRREKAKAP